MISGLPDLNYLYNRYPNAEYEIRFGEFHGHRFVNGLENKTFYSILKYIQQSPEFQQVDNEIKQKTKQKFNNRIYYTQIYSIPNRKGTIRFDYHNPNEVFVLYKSNIQNYDIKNYFTRISINQEQEKVEKSLLQNIKLEKEFKKERWSFVSSNNLFSDTKIDMTVVEDLHAQKFKYSYQLEIEFSKDTSKNQIEDMICYFLSLIQQSPIVISQFEQKRTISKYNSLFSNIPTNFKPYKLFNPLLKPVNFKKKVFTLSDKYAITDKADGVRKLVYFNEDGIYLLYPDKLVTKFSNTVVREYVNTVCDAEVIDNFNNNKIILLFDILVFQGKDIRDMQFKNRWDIVLRMRQSVNLDQLNIYLKHYLFPQDDDMYKRAERILETVRQKGLPNDGLIYNHVDELYNKNATIYKWKPVSLLTIDFLVRKDEQKKNTFKLYVKVPRGIEHFKNLVYTVKNEYIDIEQGQIVEFSYNHDIQEFIPIRIRDDKKDPNYKTVAEDVYNDIFNPITEQSITGKNLVAMRRYHNQVKKDILQNSGLEKNQYVLDIGSGRGGDILKYKELGLNVFFVEPEQDHINEMLSRMPTYNYTNHTEKYKSKNFLYYQNENGNFICILKAYGQDTDKIYKMVTAVLTENKKINAIAMFNSLTFFFENQTMFNQLMNTFSKIINHDTKFIGLVMDGMKTKETLIPLYSLKRMLFTMKKTQYYNIDNKQIYTKKDIPNKNNDNVFVNEKYRIFSENKQQIDDIVNKLDTYNKLNSIQNDAVTMKFSSNITEKPFGNQLYISLTDTIVQKQYEYLVDFEYLENYLHSTFGFTNRISYLITNDTLSSEQRQLNNLYKAFVFDMEKEKDEYIQQNGDTVQMECPETKVLLHNDYYILHCIKDENQLKTFLHIVARSILPYYIQMTNLDFHSNTTLNLILDRMIIINRLYNVLFSKTDDDNLKNTILPLLERTFKVNIHLVYSNNSNHSNKHVEHSYSQYEKNTYIYIDGNGVPDLMIKKNYDDTIDTVFGENTVFLFTDK